MKLRQIAKISVAQLAKMGTEMKRPKELSGTTYKIKVPFSNFSYYLTINDVIAENGSIKPYEVFVNTKDLTYYSWICALTRTISCFFRNCDKAFSVIEELKGVYDPGNGVYFSNQFQKNMTSVVSEIGCVLEAHINSYKKEPEIETNKESSLS